MPEIYKDLVKLTNEVRTMRDTESNNPEVKQKLRKATKRLDEAIHCIQAALAECPSK